MACVKTLGLPAVLLFLPLLALSAQLERAFPETADARAQSFNVLALSPQKQTTRGPEYLQQSQLNPRVKFEVFYQWEGSGSARRPVYYFSWVPEREFRFVYGSKGHSVVKMDARTGKVESLKVFFQDTRLETVEDIGQRTWGSFLLVIPREPKTVLSVYVEGQRIAAEIPLPWSLADTIKTPLSRWRSATADLLDWELVFPPRSRLGGQTGDLAAKIRALLPGMREVDDGAQDETGRWVFIETGAPQVGLGGFNCSGFAKWVVDGLVRPLDPQQEGLKIESSPGANDLLKAKDWNNRGSSFTRKYDGYYGDYQDSQGRQAGLMNRDPFFGLDWTRNLAKAAQEIRYPGRPVTSGALDIRSNRFCTYTPTRGFPVRNLDPILYELAVKKPGYIYLGSVNGDFKPEGAGAGDPVLNQHRHVAVFIPWIDSFGDYRLAIFDTGRETTLPRFQGTWTHHWVHLVAVEASSDFSPFPAGDPTKPVPREKPGDTRLLR